MRERDEDRLVMVVPRLAIVESKRFCTAPSEERSLSTFDRAASMAASGLAVDVALLTALVVSLPGEAPSAYTVFAFASVTMPLLCIVMDCEALVTSAPLMSTNCAAAACVTAPVVTATA